MCALLGTVPVALVQLRLLVVEPDVPERTCPRTRSSVFALGLSTISTSRSRYWKIRSKSANEACTSTAVCSIEPIGNSRVCRVVNATIVPALRSVLPATR